MPTFTVQPRAGFDQEANPGESIHRLDIRILREKPRGESSPVRLCSSTGKKSKDSIRDRLDHSSAPPSPAARDWSYSTARNGSGYHFSILMIVNGLFHRYKSSPCGAPTFLSPAFVPVTFGDPRIAKLGSNPNEGIKIFAPRVVKPSP